MDAWSTTSLGSLFQCWPPLRWKVFSVYYVGISHFLTCAYCLYTSRKSLAPPSLHPPMFAFLWSSWNSSNVQTFQRWQWPCKDIIHPSSSCSSGCNAALLSLHLLLLNHCPSSWQQAASSFPKSLCPSTEALQPQQPHLPIFVIPMGS